MDFLYEIEGRFYGTAPRVAMSKWGQQTELRNIAFFCPHCGRVWARIATESGRQDQPSLPWFASHVRCERCGNSGSIYHEYDEDCLDSFPTDVLLRELEIAARDSNWPEQRLWC